MPRSPVLVNSISPADRVQTCATDLDRNWVSCPTGVQGSESRELGGGSFPRQLVNNISEQSVDVIAPQVDCWMDCAICRSTLKCQHTFALSFGCVIHIDPIRWDADRISIRVQTRCNQILDHPNVNELCILVCHSHWLPFLDVLPRS